VKNHWLAVIVLFLVAGAWGASFTIVKSVLTRIPPEPFIVLRFTIAGIVLLAVALTSRKLPRSALRPGLILGSLVFSGYWLQTRGLMSISPSRSAFLTGLYVVMVPFCDRLLYAKRIAARAWIGCVLAAGGTTLLIGGIDARAGSATSSPSSAPFASRCTWFCRRNTARPRPRSDLRRCR
jgi:drug/metabolite transporter (DMT)-like permease